MQCGTRMPRDGLLRALAMTKTTAMTGTKTAAGIAADGRFLSIFRRYAYFGYLNSGAAFSASLVVFIDASHLLFLLS